MDHDSGQYGHGVDGHLQYLHDDAHDPETAARAGLQAHHDVSYAAGMGMPGMMGGMPPFSSATYPSVRSDGSAPLEMPQLAPEYTTDAYLQQQTWQDPLMADHVDPTDPMQWTWANAAAGPQHVAMTQQHYGMAAPTGPEQGMMYYNNNPYKSMQENFSSGSSMDPKGKRKQTSSRAATTTKSRPKAKSSHSSSKSTAKSTKTTTATTASSSSSFPPSSKASPTSTMSTAPTELARPSSKGSRNRRPSTKADAGSNYYREQISGGDGDSGDYGEGPSSPKRTQRDREHNRVAATKCRAKTKAAINKLEEDERYASEQGAYLAAVADRLRNEVLFLKSELLRHSDCDCALIQQYLARMAKLISQGSDDDLPMPTGSSTYGDGDMAAPGAPDETG